MKSALASLAAVVATATATACLPIFRLTLFVECVHCFVLLKMRRYFVPFFHIIRIVCIQYSL